MAASELEMTIAQNAASPAEVTVDGTRVRQHPLREQIEADKYAKQTAAARKTAFPIRHFKLVPPGSA